MFRKVWKVIACIDDEKEAWLCQNIFGNDNIDVELDQVIRERLTLKQAIKIYLKLSRLGIFSMIFKE